VFVTEVHSPQLNNGIVKSLGYPGMEEKGDSKRDIIWHVRSMTGDGYLPELDFAPSSCLSVSQEFGE